VVQVQFQQKFSKTSFNSKLDVVEGMYYPSHAGAWLGESVWGQPRHKREILSERIKVKDVTQVGELLLSKCEVLSLNPSSAKKINECVLWLIWLYEQLQILTFSPLNYLCFF
jgi:hypothetical protein